MGVPKYGNPQHGATQTTFFALGSTLLVGVREEMDRLVGEMYCVSEGVKCDGEREALKGGEASGLFVQGNQAQPQRVTLG